MPVGPDEQLRVFADAVRDSPHNLVSRAARNTLEQRHVPECVAFAHWLPTDMRTLVDIGSGGGFPAVVIAIFRPEITVHMIESVGKKAQFLAEITQALGLDSVVHATRVERLAHSRERPRADAVTARAVAPLASLAPMAAPFLRPGGFLYAIKGERWHEDLVAARDSLKRVTLRVHTTPDENRDYADGTLPRIIALRKA